MHRHNRPKKTITSAQAGVYPEPDVYTYSFNIWKHCSTCMSCEVMFEDTIMTYKPHEHDPDKSQFIMGLRKMCLEGKYSFHRYMTPCELCDHNTFSRYEYNCPPTPIPIETVVCRHCVIAVHTISLDVSIQKQRAYVNPKAKTLP